MSHVRDTQTRINNQMPMKTSFLALLLFISSLVSVSAQAIKSGDPLRIAIRGVPAEEQALVSGPYTVAPNGTIRMPMLKSPISARGISAAALGVRIEQAYKSAGIYTTPAFSVINERAANERVREEQRLVTVGGEVVRSGPVEFIKGMTLFQAVETAGGATPFGSIKRVKLLRKGKQAVYDLRNDKNKAIPVYPNDTIVVPQKTWTGN